MEHSFLLQHCLLNIFFQYNGKFFMQNKGLAMGSPLSPVLANLFMSKLEVELKQLEDFPRIWWRYVDDVFAVVKRSKIDDVLKMINSQYDSIKFTSEVEVDKSLAFLDLKISRNSTNNLEFDILRKQTSTTFFYPV